MKIFLLLIVIISSVLTGCGTTKQASIETNNQIDDPVVTTSIKDTIIEFNNKKFKMLSDEMVSGAHIYDLALKEKGTIKGTIVVVNKHLTVSENISKIAADTYRVQLKAGQTLNTLYKSLIKDKRNLVVELEVDYSPIIGLYK